MPLLALRLLWDLATFAGRLEGCRATAVYSAGRVEFQESLPSLLHTAAREIAVAAVQSPRVTVVGVATRVLEVFAAWVFRARRTSAGSLARVTVVAIRFGRSVAAGKLLFRVIGVVTRTGKSEAARIVAG